MVSRIRKEEVRKLIGQQVYAVKKDGSMVNGKLIRINGNTLILSPKKVKGAQTKALIPLVLFDLLAIGTSPFAFGGYGYGGYGGGGYGGGYGYGGYPGFFW